MEVSNYIYLPSLIKISQNERKKEKLKFINKSCDNRDSITVEYYNIGIIIPCT